MSPKFFCEADYAPDEIQAGLSDGTLTAWRTDSQGRRWFRQLPKIVGVPREVEMLEADGIDEDEIEADDGECVLLGEDGEVEIIAADDVLPQRGIDQNGSTTWSI